MKRVPIEIFGVSEFFYRKFVKKNFRGRGPQKSTILGLFSKIDVRNFCQLGKNVFFVLPIFLKNRGNGGLFLGVRPKIFSQLCTNVESFQKKIFGIGGKLVDLCGFFSARFFLPSTVAAHLSPTSVLCCWNQFSG